MYINGNSDLNVIKMVSFITPFELKHLVHYHAVVFVVEMAFMNKY